ncbi:MAG: putative lipopolysaccharide heptosyltransferase [Ramlibacter sp.]|jgi:heptosyltransferase-3|uniref:putative lipopolysaccharide heptosyltransferase III n=1 Tax=Ramlibacter sp. TaxID=1917967 RepID=UPI00261C930E|nr:putative lipopolysaccharide heptosyltransferase III [Ramlibacter sp.]MDB5750057.1 putative lipopolysaccharide heptosyltransferase [Ramlibacter sp.]
MSLAGLQPPDGIAASQLRRVLVIKLRHHGDVLLASPVLTALKAAAPQAQIDALVYADTSGMLRGHPALDQLHELPRASRTAGWLDRLRSERALLATLRARRYDLLVHLTDHPRGALLAWLLRPRWSVSHERDHGQWWWRRVFSHIARQPRGTQRATVERHLDALRRIGIHPAHADKRPTLHTDAATLESARGKLRAAGWTGKPYAVLHPGSRWLFKAWTVQGNARVIEHLTARGLAVVLTAAPDPRETQLCDAILAASGAPCIDLRGQLTLPELGAVIRQAAVFAGVDSVPMHIAAAVGTPGIGIFGPSKDLEWGPWSDRMRVVASRDFPCRPCGIDGCGGSKRSECLVTLPAQQVIAVLDQVLDRHGPA